MAESMNRIGKASLNPELEQCRVYGNMRHAYATIVLNGGKEAR